MWPLPEKTRYCICYESRSGNLVSLTMNSHTIKRKSLQNDIQRPVKYVCLAQNKESLILLDANHTLWTSKNWDEPFTSYQMDKLCTIKQILHVIEPMWMCFLLVEHTRPSGRTELCLMEETQHTSGSVMWIDLRVGQFQPRKLHLIVDNRTKHMFSAARGGYVLTAWKHSLILETRCGGFLRFVGTRHGNIHFKNDWNTCLSDDLIGDVQKIVRARDNHSIIYQNQHDQLVIMERKDDTLKPNYMMSVEPIKSIHVFGKGLLLVFQDGTQNLRSFEALEYQPDTLDDMRVVDFVHPDMSRDSIPPVYVVDSDGNLVRCTYLACKLVPKQQICDLEADDLPCMKACLHRCQEKGLCARLRRKSPIVRTTVE